MTILKTKTFILRPLRLSDAKPYLEVMRDEETIRNMERVPKNLAEAKKEIKGYLRQVKEKDSAYFTIDIRGRYAGNVVLQHQDWNPASEDGRVHIWIHPSFRNKGLATKALKTIVTYGLRTTFKRIFAQCKAINSNVISINKRLGFKKVRTYLNEAGVKKILWVKQRAF